MMTEPSHSPPALSRRRLWFGAFAPAAAWGVHGLAGVALVANSCRAGRAALARWGVIGLTVLALAIALSALLVARQSYSRITHPMHLARAEARDASEMLAVVGMLSAIAFGIGILWGGLSAFLLRDLCEMLR